MRTRRYMHGRRRKKSPLPLVSTVAMSLGSTGRIRPEDETDLDKAKKLKAKNSNEVVDVNIVNQDMGGTKLDPASKENTGTQNMVKPKLKKQPEEQLEEGAGGGQSEETFEKRGWGQRTFGF